MSDLASKFVIAQFPVEVISKSKDKNMIKKYIVKSTEDYVSSSLPYIEFPTIDLQRLLDSDEELQKFDHALSSLGAFQLINHGIESFKFDQVLNISKQFFSLPIEEKQKYARSVSMLGGWKHDKLQGWGTDQMVETQAFNWNDRLMLTMYPIQFRNFKYWPSESVPNFRKVFEEYASETKRIKEVLFKALSKILKLPEDNLLNKYANDGTMISRITYYPASPYPDRMLGSSPHTDTNMFTTVLPDNEVEGLQFEKDGQWFKVPIIPYALIVNVADMLEIMTNGRVKSPVHRVATNSEKGRISIATGIGAPPNTEIGPLKEFITEERPQLYPYLKNSADVTANYYAAGKIFMREVRKYGPNILSQQFAS
ncbi:protein SRG1-like [Silene latifolia]|uniref:protein SRG1-like n=1 Tax=Silene latifolia TaxID=37657 RepID=UPI003D77E5E5